MILTDRNGVPLVPPERDEFPPGIEGDVAWLRADSAHRDRVADLANRAFDARFRKSLRGR